LPVFSSLSHPVECTIQQFPMWWGRKKNDDGLSHCGWYCKHVKTQHDFGKKIQNKLSHRTKI
jgi:hypothetical protein